MDSALLMIRPNFLTPQDRLELERCVRRQREDHGIARRANALLLLDDGESCAQIARFLYLDDDTIRTWFKFYDRDGWEVLAIDGWQGGKSHIMANQKAAFVAWLEGRFCRSTGEIRAYIAAGAHSDVSAHLFRQHPPIRTGLSAQL